MKTIAICIPSQGQWVDDFGMSLAAMCFTLPGLGVKIHLAKRSTSMLPEGRTSLVLNALELEKQYGPVDYLLWFDCDMEFPQDTLARLMAHDKDVVGVIYPQRGPPGLLVGHPLEMNPVFPAHGLCEMKFVGFGIVLVKMKVIKEMPYAIDDPYFQFTYNQDGIISEDVGFCEKARAAGFRVWADVDLSREVTHWGRQEFRAGI